MPIYVARLVRNVARRVTLAHVEDRREARHRVDRQEPASAARLHHPRHLRGRHRPHRQRGEVAARRQGEPLRRLRHRARTARSSCINLHISPYERASYNNHEPTRTRKLLLHKREIGRLIGAIERQGLTLDSARAVLQTRDRKSGFGTRQGKKAARQARGREGEGRRSRDRARVPGAMIVALARGVPARRRIAAARRPTGRSSSRTRAAPTSVRARGDTSAVRSCAPTSCAPSSPSRCRISPANRWMLIVERRRHRGGGSEPLRQDRRPDVPARRRARSAEGRALRAAPTRGRDHPASRDESRVGRGALRTARLLRLAGSSRRPRATGRTAPLSTCAERGPPAGEPHTERAASQTVRATASAATALAPSRRRRCRTRRPGCRHARPNRWRPARTRKEHHARRRQARRSGARRSVAST